LYAQDDWKITPRFTLNIGVRYDVDFGFVDHAHAAENRTFQALKIIGSPFARKVVEDDKNNLSPRIGFAGISAAWPFSLRGGYGIYFDQSFLNVPLFAVQQANPEIYATFFNDGRTSASIHRRHVFRAAEQPLPARAAECSILTSSRHTRSSGTSGTRRRSAADMAIEFDYVHILGLHEFTSLDINPRIGPLINAQRSTPNPGRILTPQFAAHAAELMQHLARHAVRPHHGGPVGQPFALRRFHAAFKKRYSNKFQLNAHYTLAKSQAWFGATADFGLQPQNLFAKLIRLTLDQHAEDERHRFVISGIFDLPWAFRSRRSSRWRRLVPTAFPVCRLRHQSRRREQRSRVRESGIDDQHKLPLNDTAGDNFSQLNVRVSKFFNWGEKYKLGLFFEAFNVFNTGNFGNQFQNRTGEPDFGKPVNFFGATGSRAAGNSVPGSVRRPL
jgi:hypothetical protein